MFKDHWTNTSTGSHFLGFWWFQIPFPLIFVPKNETNYATILHTENKSKNESKPKKTKVVTKHKSSKKRCDWCFLGRWTRWRRVIGRKFVFGVFCVTDRRACLFCLTDSFFQRHSPAVVIVIVTSYSLLPSSCLVFFAEPILVLARLSLLFLLLCLVCLWVLVLLGIWSCVKATHYRLYNIDRPCFVHKKANSLSFS